MDFFSYISKSKIDMLYDQLPEGLINELVIENQKETHADLEIEASFGFKQWLPSLLGKTSFGRKGRITYGRKIKETYAHKLQIILKYLLQENKILDFPNLNEKQLMSADYLFFHGEFVVKSFGENIDVPKVLSKDFATLYSSTNIGNHKYDLMLNCSLKNFSETNGDEYIFTSSNVPFFRDGIAVKFKTLFKVISLEKNKIHASPLFLSQDNDCKIDV